CQTQAYEPLFPLQLSRVRAITNLFVDATPVCNELLLRRSRLLMRSIAGRGVIKQLMDRGEQLIGVAGLGQDLGESGLACVLELTGQRISGDGNLWDISGGFLRVERSRHLDARQAWHLQVEHDEVWQFAQRHCEAGGAIIGSQDLKTGSAQV